MPNLLRRIAQNFRSSILMLRPVDVSAVIDRTFRFLEMSFLTTLVGIAYSVVDQEWSKIITYVMSISAGIYLAKPVVEWLAAKNKMTTTFHRSISSLVLGAFFATLIMPLQTLVRATFQIDQKGAVAAYARLEGNMAAGACARGHGSFEECVQAGKETEERILSHHNH